MPKRPRTPRTSTNDRSGGSRGPRRSRPTRDRRPPERQGRARPRPDGDTDPTGAHRSSGNGVDSDARHAGALPGGPHELGQNDLVDGRVIAEIVRLAGGTTGPLVELGAGTGNLTTALARLGRPITAIEIDPRRADTLRSRLTLPRRGEADPRTGPREGRRRPGSRARPDVEVVVGDVLHHRYPRHSHVVVGNLPFHLTTEVLRMLLRSPHWTDAVLLTQWEVARRRAGVGGATMMTAQWWPWYAFSLVQRVPRRAFNPAPAIDGGVLTVRRRPDPLVAGRDRAAYQRWVARVFTGRGHGLRAVLTGAGATRGAAQAFLRDHGLPPTALPRDLTAEQWADLFARTHRRP